MVVGQLPDPPSPVLGATSLPAPASLPGTLLLELVVPPVVVPPLAVVPPLVVVPPLAVVPPVLLVPPFPDPALLATELLLETPPLLPAPPALETELELPPLPLTPDVEAVLDPAEPAWPTEPEVAELPPPPVLLGSVLEALPPPPEQPSAKSKAKAGEVKDDVLRSAENDFMIAPFTKRPMQGGNAETSQYRPSTPQAISSQGSDTKRTNYGQSVCAWFGRFVLKSQEDHATNGRGLLDHSSYFLLAGSRDSISVMMSFMSCMAARKGSDVVRSTPAFLSRVTGKSDPPDLRRVR
jgi:hypothetical protein